MTEARDKRLGALWHYQFASLAPEVSVGKKRSERKSESEGERKQAGSKEKKTMRRSHCRMTTGGV